MTPTFNGQEAVSALCSTYTTKEYPELAFTGVVMIHFTDLDEYHGWDIQGDTCGYADSSKKDDAVATIHVTSENYDNIINKKKITSEEAFLKQMITVDGELEMLIRLSHLFQLR